MKKGIAFFLICAFLSPHLHAALTPEEEAMHLGKILKPISDEAWKSLAGDKASETYEISKGDTLWSISSRLFGDPKVWPKIWALNNRTITNPHLIKPKNLIAFLPGTGTSLPSVTIQAAPELPQADEVSSQEQNNFQPPPPSVYPRAPLPRGYTHSQEWKLLQPQAWESVQTRLPQQVDPDGFDRRSKIAFKVSTGFELATIAASEKLHLLGEIVASRSAGKFLSLGDMVYIESEKKLKPGEIYGITPSSPTSLSSSGRSGYSYPIIGKVAILGGSEEGFFVGRILTANSTIRRGSHLFALPPRAKNIKPIPGPEPIVGNVLVDKEISTATFAQHNQVIIDRGSEDGIAEGMVFRVYQYRDPSTRKTITDRDMIIDADILIAQVSELFSVGLMIRSLDILKSGTEAVLLTDVSDLLKRREFMDFSQNETATPLTVPDAAPDLVVPGVPTEELPAPPDVQTAPSDELDGLDQGGELTPDEERELKQLEQFKEEEKQAAPGGESSPAPESGSGTPESPAPETAPIPETPEPSATPGGDIAPEVPAPAPTSTPAPPPAPETPAPPAPSVPGAEIVPDL